MTARDQMPLGLHPTMPAEEYHAVPAMSAGGLKRMRQSPAHFYGKQLDPNRPEAGEPTPAMKAGTLFHTALFEPATLAARYAIKPEGLSLASKEGKAWKAALPAGVEAIAAEDMAKAQAQARRVLALPDVAALMTDGMPEASAFWIDPETGELWGNFPQTYSHVGVINSAFRLSKNWNEAF